jgi:16S rRNA (uracil1498-N3)-methyltransferase
VDDDFAEAQIAVMARFFIPSERIRNKRGTMIGEELEHLRKVLRLRPGDLLRVFDDAGWEHEAVIRGFTADQGEIEILESYRAERESALNVSLAVGLTKGEKMDLVVEKATELGIYTIIPFVSAYTVPKLDERKIDKRANRWEKIALSAAKQCGRTRIPKILSLCEFRELITRARTDVLKLLFWEREGRQTLKELRQIEREVREVLLVVGPEGGFSLEEIEKAQENGFHSIALGRRILRAETAAVTAMALVQFLWGDLGESPLLALPASSSIT